MAVRALLVALLISVAQAGRLRSRKGNVPQFTFGGEGSEALVGEMLREELMASANTAQDEPDVPLGGGGRHNRSAEIASDPATYAKGDKFELTKIQTFKDYGSNWNYRMGAIAVYWSHTTGCYVAAFSFRTRCVDIFEIYSDYSFAAKKTHCVPNDYGSLQTKSFGRAMSWTRWDKGSSNIGLIVSEFTRDNIFMWELKLSDHSFLSFSPIMIDSTFNRGRAMVRLPEVNPHIDRVYVVGTESGAANHQILNVMKQQRTTIWGNGRVDARVGVSKKDNYLWFNNRRVWTITSASTQGFRVSYMSAHKAKWTISQVFNIAGGSDAKNQFRYYLEGIPCHALTHIMCINNCYHPLTGSKRLDSKAKNILERKFGATSADDVRFAQGYSLWSYACKGKLAEKRVNAGSTGAASTELRVPAMTHIKLSSNGKYSGSGDYARFYIGHKQVHSSSKRGLQFVTIDPGTGATSHRAFDTYNGGASVSRALSLFLFGLPCGTTVMCACKDECQRQLGADARAAMMLVLGATELPSITYRDSYGIISTVCNYKYVGSTLKIVPHKEEVHPSAPVDLTQSTFYLPGRPFSFFVSQTFTNAQLGNYQHLGHSAGFAPIPNSRNWLMTFSASTDKNKVSNRDRVVLVEFEPDYVDDHGNVNTRYGHYKIRRSFELTESNTETDSSSDRLSYGSGASVCPARGTIFIYSGLKSSKKVQAVEFDPVSWKIKKSGTTRYSIDANTNVAADLNPTPASIYGYNVLPRVVHSTNGHSVGGNTNIPRLRAPYRAEFMLKINKNWNTWFKVFMVSPSNGFSGSKWPLLEVYQRKLRLTTDTESGTTGNFLTTGRWYNVRIEGTQSGAILFVNDVEKISLRKWPTWRWTRWNMKVVLSTTSGSTQASVSHLLVTEANSEYSTYSITGAADRFRNTPAKTGGLPIWFPRFTKTNNRHLRELYELTPVITNLNGLLTYDNYYVWDNQDVGITWSGMEIKMGVGCWSDPYYTYRAGYVIGETTNYQYTITGQTWKQGDSDPLSLVITGATNNMDSGDFLYGVLEMTSSYDGGVFTIKTDGMRLAIPPTISLLRAGETDCSSNLDSASVFFEREDQGKLPYISGQTLSVCYTTTKAWAIDSRKLTWESSDGHTKTKTFGGTTASGCAEDEIDCFFNVAYTPTYNFGLEDGEYVDITLKVTEESTEATSETDRIYIDNSPPVFASYAFTSVWIWQSAERLSYSSLNVGDPHSGVDATYFALTSTEPYDSCNSGCTIYKDYDSSVGAPDSNDDVNELYITLTTDCQTCPTLAHGDSFYVNFKACNGAYPPLCTTKSTLITIDETTPVTTGTLDMEAIEEETTFDVTLNWTPATEPESGIVHQQVVLHYWTEDDALDEEVKHTLTLATLSTTASTYSTSWEIVDKATRVNFEILTTNNAGLSSSITTGIQQLLSFVSGPVYTGNWAWEPASLGVDHWDVQWVGFIPAYVSSAYTQDFTYALTISTCSGATTHATLAGLSASSGSAYDTQLSHTATFSADLDTANTYKACVQLFYTDANGVTRGRGSNCTDCKTVDNVDPVSTLVIRPGQYSTYQEAWCTRNGGVGCVHDFLISGAGDLGVGISVVEANRVASSTLEISYHPLSGPSTIHTVESLATNSETTITLSNAMVDGTVYTFQYTAVDEAENTGTSTVIRTCDGTAPIPGTVLDGKGVGDIQKQHSKTEFHVSWTPWSDAASGVAQYKVEFMGTAGSLGSVWAALNESTASLTITDAQAALLDSVYVRVTGYDWAGNSASAYSNGVFVDKDVTVGGVYDGTAEVEVDYTTEQSTFQCTWDAVNPTDAAAFGSVFEYAVCLTTDTNSADYGCQPIEVGASTIVPSGTLSHSFTLVSPVASGTVVYCEVMVRFPNAPGGPVQEHARLSDGFMVDTEAPVVTSPELASPASAYRQTGSDDMVVWYHANAHDITMMVDTGKIDEVSPMTYEYSAVLEVANNSSNSSAPLEEDWAPFVCCSFQLNLAEGDWVVWVRLTDSVGFQANATAPVKVDFTPPAFGTVVDGDLTNEEHVQMEQWQTGTTGKGLSLTDLTDTLSCSWSGFTSPFLDTVEVAYSTSGILAPTSGWEALAGVNNGSHTMVTLGVPLVYGGTYHCWIRATTFAQRHTIGVSNGMRVAESTVVQSRLRFSLLRDFSPSNTTLSFVWGEPSSFVKKFTGTLLTESGAVEQAAVAYSPWTRGITFSGTFTHDQKYQFLLQSHSLVRNITAAQTYSHLVKVDITPPTLSPTAYWSDDCSTYTVIPAGTDAESDVENSRICDSPLSQPDSCALMVETSYGRVPEITVQAKNSTQSRTLRVGVENGAGLASYAEVVLLGCLVPQVTVSHIPSTYGTQGYQFKQSEINFNLKVTGPTSLGSCNLRLSVDPGAWNPPSGVLSIPCATSTAITGQILPQDVGLTSFVPGTYYLFVETIFTDLPKGRGSFAFIIDPRPIKHGRVIEHWRLRGGEAVDGDAQGTGLCASPSPVPFDVIFDATSPTSVPAEGANKGTTRKAEQLCPAATWLCFEGFKGTDSPIITSYRVTSSDGVVMLPGGELEPKKVHCVQRHARSEYPQASALIEGRSITGQRVVVEAFGVNIVAPSATGLPEVLRVGDCKDSDANLNWGDPSNPQASMMTSNDKICVGGKVDIPGSEGIDRPLYLRFHKGNLADSPVIAEVPLIGGRNTWTIDLANIDALKNKPHTAVSFAVDFNDQAHHRVQSTGTPSASQTILLDYTPPVFKKVDFVCGQGNDYDRCDLTVELEDPESGLEKFEYGADAESGRDHISKKTYNNPASTISVSFSGPRMVEVIVVTLKVVNKAGLESFATARATNADFSPPAHHAEAFTLGGEEQRTMTVKSMCDLGVEWGKSQDLDSGVVGYRVQVLKNSFPIYTIEVPSDVHSWSAVPNCPPSIASATPSGLQWIRIVSINKFGLESERLLSAFWYNPVTEASSYPELKSVWVGKPDANIAVTTEKTVTFYGHASDGSKMGLSDFLWKLQGVPVASYTENGETVYGCKVGHISNNWEPIGEWVSTGPVPYYEVDINSHLSAAPAPLIDALCLRTKFKVMNSNGVESIEKIESSAVMIERRLPAVLSISATAERSDLTETGTVLSRNLQVWWTVDEPAIAIINTYLVVEYEQIDGTAFLTKSWDGLTTSFSDVISSTSAPMTITVLVQSASNRRAEKQIRIERHDLTLTAGSPYLSSTSSSFTLSSSTTLFSEAIEFHPEVCVSSDTGAISNAEGVTYSETCNPATTITVDQTSDSQEVAVTIAGLANVGSVARVVVEAKDSLGRTLATAYGLYKQVIQESVVAPGLVLGSCTSSSLPLGATQTVEGVTVAYWWPTRESLEFCTPDADPAAGHKMTATLSRLEECVGDACTGDIWVQVLQNTYTTLSLTHIQDLEGAASQLSSTEGLDVWKLVVAVCSVADHCKDSTIVFGIDDGEIDESLGATTVDGSLSVEGLLTLTLSGTIVPASGVSKQQVALGSTSINHQYLEWTTLTTITTPGTTTAAASSVPTQSGTVFLFFRTTSFSGVEIVVTSEFQFEAAPNCATGNAPILGVEGGLLNLDWSAACPQTATISQVTVVFRFDGINQAGVRLGWTHRTIAVADGPATENRTVTLTSPVSVADSYQAIASGLTAEELGAVDTVLVSAEATVYGNSHLGTVLRSNTIPMSPVPLQVPATGLRLIGVSEELMLGVSQETLSVKVPSSTKWGCFPARWRDSCIFEAQIMNDASGAEVLPGTVTNNIASFDLEDSVRNTCRSERCHVKITLSTFWGGKASTTTPSFGVDDVKGSQIVSMVPTIVEGSIHAVGKEDTEEGVRAVVHRAQLSVAYSLVESGLKMARLTIQGPVQGSTFSTTDYTTLAREGTLIINYTAPDCSFVRVCLTVLDVSGGSTDACKNLDHDLSPPRIGAVRMVGPAIVGGSSKVCFDEGVVDHSTGCVEKVSISIQYAVADAPGAAVGEEDWGFAQEATHDLEKYTAGDSTCKLGGWCDQICTFVTVPNGSIPLPVGTQEVRARAFVHAESCAGVVPAKVATSTTGVVSSMHGLAELEVAALPERCSYWERQASRSFKKWEGTTAGACGLRVQWTPPPSVPTGVEVTYVIFLVSKTNRGRSTMGVTLKDYPESWRSSAMLLGMMEEDTTLSWSEAYGSTDEVLMMTRWNLLKYVERVVVVAVATGREGDVTLARGMVPIRMQDTTALPLSGDGGSSATPRNR